MKLRLNAKEREAQIEVEIKQLSPLHEGVLVSLPIERIPEKKPSRSKSFFFEFCFYQENVIYNTGFIRINRWMAKSW